MIVSGFAAGGAGFPDHGIAAERDDKARGEAAEDAVTDDQIRQRAADNGVVRRGGEGKQHAFLRIGKVNAVGLGGGHDETRGGRAKQAMRLFKAARAGHEYDFADTLRCGVRADDAADGFVSRHQRITHAREGRHFAGPHQALGSGADAGPEDIDDDILRLRSSQGERAQAGSAVAFEQNRPGAQVEPAQRRGTGRPGRLGGLRTLRLDDARFHNCHFSLTV